MQSMLGVGRNYWLKNFNFYLIPLQRSIDVQFGQLFGTRVVKIVSFSRKPTWPRRRYGGKLTERQTCQKHSGRFLFIASDGRPSLVRSPGKLSQYSSVAKNDSEAQ